MISVVIPTLDAGDSLSDTIASVADADEIIVVDGGSSDFTVSVAQAWGATLLCAAKGRGNQLAAGADAAMGDWLLFLHADTRLGARWRDGALSHIEAHPNHAACFCFRLDAPVWQARWIERGVALRTRLFGLPYGDQGLLISRAFYDALGGYAPLPLFEDVDLARRIGKPRLHRLAVDATTSAIRWREGGWVGRSLRNLSLLLRYLWGIPPARLAQRYR